MLKLSNRFYIRFANRILRNREANNVTFGMCSKNGNVYLVHGGAEQKEPFCVSCQIKDINHNIVESDFDASILEFYLRHCKIGITNIKHIPWDLYSQIAQHIADFIDGRPYYDCHFNYVTYDDWEYDVQLHLSFFYRDVEGDDGQHHTRCDAINVTDANIEVRDENDTLYITNWSNDKLIKTILQ